MASVTTSHGATAPHLLSTLSETGVLAAGENSGLTAPKPNNLQAEFVYYKDPGDGSPVPETVIGKPETFNLPAEKLMMPVYDIRGKEDEYSLDKTGFQIFKHESQEKEFLDTSRIQNIYYPEIEYILKIA